MKHLPVGSIKEVKVKDQIIYDVSLFHGQVHEVFEKQADALELIQHHCDAFLRMGETDAICVEYYGYKKQMHYIMIDTIWGDRNKPQIHEQTRYEYMRSHSLYFPRWAARRVVNERHVSSSDILRATVNFRPWYSILHIVLALLIAALSIVYIVEAVYYLDTEMVDGKHIVVNDKTADLWLSLGLFAFALLGAGFTLAMMYLSRKRITSASYDYSDINWHRWYMMRKWTSIIFSILSAGAIAVLSVFSHDHLTDGITLNPNDPFAEKTQLLISIYALYVLFIFLFCSMVGSFVFIMVHKRHLLKKYFSEEQIKQFKKWLRNTKEREVILTAGREYFVLGPEASEYPVSKELQISREIRLKYSPEEYREYKVKAIHHFHEAMKAYIRKLREAQLDNLSKNNQ